MDTEIEEAQEAVLEVETEEATEGISTEMGHPEEILETGQEDASIVAKKDTWLVNAQNVNLFLI